MSDIMNNARRRGGHTFHLPVLGTAFSVESPLKLARYGISSVVSLVDDLLLEQMREHHCREQGLPFEKIDAGEEDYRARRITAYLDLLGRIVGEQVRELQASPFREGSEITRYFEMLPEGPLRESYESMKGLPEGPGRKTIEEELRRQALPGSINVNIMTKLDRRPSKGGELLPPEQSDAMAALRGFALSSLRSSVVFSAGMHPRLYSYAANFEDFFCDSGWNLPKRVVLKVSDYRSAEIQGRFLAKRGLWVSEFRVESALNCGGHAFPSNGSLMGPILEEFKENRDNLAATMHRTYCKTLKGLGRPEPPQPLPLRLTVQGGIGSSGEDRFLRERFGVDGTGWGTPFMLVPEATTVDAGHLKKLTNLREGDVYLSGSSPLGAPFWNLRTSASEEKRRQRLAAGRPGSSCPKGHVKFNTELTAKPACLASRSYQKRRLASLPSEDLAEDQLKIVTENVTSKSCICHDLAGAATLMHGIDSDATPAVCCGPNIKHFSRPATLAEMVGHIYGRTNLLKDDGRPHMFLREFELYIEYLAAELERYRLDLSALQPKQFMGIRENLLQGAGFYRDDADEIAGPEAESFRRSLQELQARLDALPLPETK